MKKPLTDQEILEKAASYCAYQERSEQDVRNRLGKWDVAASKTDAVIDNLKKEGFLDNERFAEAFVRGRFRLKKWGRKKIRYGLLQHGIDNEAVENALALIDDEEYILVLQDLLARRVRGKANPSLQDKSKTFNFLGSKGYEYELIMRCWEEMYPGS